MPLDQRRERRLADAVGIAEEAIEELAVAQVPGDPGVEQAVERPEEPTRCGSVGHALHSWV